MAVCYEFCATHGGLDLLGRDKAPVARVLQLISEAECAGIDESFRIHAFL